VGLLVRTKWVTQLGIDGVVATWRLDF